MNRNIFLTILVFSGMILAVGFQRSGAQAELKQPYSPAFLQWGDRQNGLFILEATSHRLDFLSVPNGSLTKGPIFDQLPTGMTLSESKLFVTSDHGSGMVHVIDPESLQEIKSFRAGAGARSPIGIPSKNMLAVCHTWQDEVGIYEHSNGRLIKRIPVLRQPFVSALSADEKYLFVTNFITHQRADQDTVSSAVTIINLETLEVEKHLLLANGSNALRGISLSSNGEYIIVSHNLGRFQVPTTQLEQGWMNTSAMSIIKVSSLSYEGTVLLDEPENGAAGSWGISCYKGQMAIAHSGTHDISIINEESFFDKLAATKNREILSYDLNFLGDMRERVKLPGNGPRAVCQNDYGVFTGMYFSDTINQLVAKSGKYQIHSYALNDGFFESQERLGEKYFNDASYCFQHWQACTGCHPLDARTDGLNWDLLNDGMGNPRNCKSMLLAHETPPAMITGIRPDAQTAVRAGFKHIQFTQVPESYAQAVDAYLISLQPLPSPFLINGKLSPSAKRGKKIFRQQGCQDCHPHPIYSDMKMHTFASPNDMLGEQSLDSPTLIEVWRTGPYLHDGRCESMKAVFEREEHGLNKPLSSNDLNDLVTYVLSL